MARCMTIFFIILGLFLVPGKALAAAAPGKSCDCPRRSQRQSSSALDC